MKGKDQLTYGPEFTPDIELNWSCPLLVMLVGEMHNNID